MVGPCVLGQPLGDGYVNLIITLKKATAKDQHKQGRVGTDLHPKSYDITFSRNFILNRRVQGLGHGFGLLARNARLGDLPDAGQGVDHGQLVASVRSSRRSVIFQTGKQLVDSTAKLESWRSPLAKLRPDR